MRAERMGVSIIGSPLLHLWRRGKEICGVPSPLITASCSMTRTRVPYTVLWTHPQEWGTQDLLGGFSIK